jgi:hypothetical protein
MVEQSSWKGYCPVRTEPNVIKLRFDTPLGKVQERAKMVPNRSPKLGERGGMYNNLDDRFVLYFLTSTSKLLTVPIPNLLPSFHERPSGRHSHLQKKTFF